mmetsp:Transcript_10854/g.20495  ORF Transcript_10854/g.20495 Transcript_10854/m.20495 type:complete len:209 (-) Transcript_10854:170-796(-)
MRIRHLLDGVPDHIERNPRRTDCNGRVQGFLCCLTQALCLWCHIPNKKHSTRVSMVSIQKHRNVYVYYIPVPKLSGVRYAVANALVDGCANALREASISQRRRISSSLYNHLVHCFVNGVRSDTWFRHFPSHFQHLGCKLARVSHLFNPLFPVDLVVVVPGWVLFRSGVRRPLDMSWDRQGRGYRTRLQTIILPSVVFSKAFFPRHQF